MKVMHQTPAFVLTIFGLCLGLGWEASGQTADSMSRTHVLNEEKADDPILLGNKLRQSSKSAFSDLILSDPEIYRIGDEWNKKEISKIDQIPSQLQPAALASAKVGGATGFYIGNHGGKHIMMTNFHVCDGRLSCSPGAYIHFPLLKIYARVGSFLGKWPDIDTALFSININEGDEDKLADNYLQVRFDHVYKPFDRLASFGFGGAANKARNLTGIWDEDCVVASRELRMIADPDSKNPFPYRVWSFSSGCDVSHGDSGSAFIDFDSGEVVGILWTGTVPKKEEAQNSQKLEQAILNQNSRYIWDNLTYTVPASKIGEKFALIRSQPDTDLSLKRIVNSLLTSSGYSNVFPSP